MLMLQVILVVLSAAHVGVKGLPPETTLVTTTKAPTTTVYVPNAPEITGHSSTSTSITVTWTHDDTRTIFFVFYRVSGSNNTNTGPISGMTTTIPNLIPHTVYIVSVYVEVGGQRSTPGNAIIRTNPSTPSGLSLTSNDVGYVQVKWTSSDHGVSFVYVFKHENETKAVARVNTRTATSTELRPPGANYTFCVTAYAYEKYSGEKCLDFTLKPTPVQQLTALAINSEVARLTWNTYEESMQQSFDIGFIGQFVEIRPIYGIKVNASPYYKFNLYPGENYTFFVNASSYGVKSEERSASCVLHPSAPVLVCNKGTDFIELIITKRHGLVDEYDIRCSGSSCPGLVTVPSSGDIVRKTFAGLTPIMNYTFEVIAKRLGEVSLPAVKVCITQEGAPGVVKNVKVWEITPVSVFIVWTQPTETNGVLQFYSLTYSGRKMGMANTTTISKNITDAGPVIYNERISDLIAGYTYEFTITATTVATGPGVSVTVTTPTLQVLPAMLPSVLNAYSNQISLCLRNPFTDIFGRVINYSVIVTPEKKHGSLEDGILDTWASTQKEDVLQPYVAVDRKVDLFTNGQQCPTMSRAKRQETQSDSVMMVIGVSPNCDPTATSVYCNGPLQPDTDYYVLVRGYNEEGDFSNGPVSDAIRTMVLSQSSPNIVAIIVPVVLAVLAIVTIIVCVTICHRRRNHRNDEPQTHTDDVVYYNTKREEPSEIVGVYETIDGATEPEHAYEMAHPPPVYNNDNMYAHLNQPER